MNNQQKFYGVRKKSLADAINYISGLRYMIFDDEENKNKKIYSFEDTEVFRKVLTELTSLKNKFN